MGGAKHTCPPPIFLNGGSDNPAPPVPTPLNTDTLYVIIYNQSARSVCLV